MNLKKALILSAAVMSLGLATVSASYAADDDAKAAVATDVKADVKAPVHKTTHHRHHGAKHKGAAMKKDAAPKTETAPEAPKTNQ
jgi:hypothetical protein